ncbi:hypothetical protein E4L98_09450 [Duganella callida]|uniref:Lipoprotein n=2 Tax=Duganella callida TaxID=2561932 RepID=A0A4Y9SIT5_9BURK|nr:hypothetical protein E4L98_09450 [Duganella callida]
MKNAILRQLIILPMLAALMALLHACSAARANPPARFTNTYVLRQGASVAITPAMVGDSGAAPVLRLERVNDSRCHPGAVCVWAGYISFSFALLLPDGSNSSFVLSDKMPGGSGSVTRNGLSFTLTGFEPTDVPAKTEPAPDYQVSLKVSNINPP